MDFHKLLKLALFGEPVVEEQLAGDITTNGSHTTAYTNPTSKELKNIILSDGNKVGGNDIMVRGLFNGTNFIFWDNYEVLHNRVIEQLRLRGNFAHIFLAPKHRELMMTRNRYFKPEDMSSSEYYKLALNNIATKVGEA